MAKEFRLFKENDKSIVSMFVKILKEINKGSTLNFTIEPGIANIEVPSNALEKNDLIKKIISQKSQIFRKISCNINVNNSSVNIAFSRNDKDFDGLTINFTNRPQPIAPNDVIDIISAICKHAKVYNPEENVSKILGPELEAFYGKREQALLRLEGLSQRIIEDNEKYKIELNSEYLRKKKELEEDCKTRKDELEEVHQKNEAEFEEREHAINEKLKQIDDLDNRNSRRKLREQIKTEIEARSKIFKLTRSTSLKRFPIHILFISLISIIIIAISFLGYKIYNTADIESSIEIKSWIRFSLFIVSLVVTIIFYIRWNDRWAQMHADEEFRLKRLDLDIDRASWIVEMAMEWKDEKQKDIPKELLDKLTHNLFENITGKGLVKHPYEDIIRRLLDVSAEARVPIPGGGEIKIGKRGLKKLANMEED